MYMYMHVVDLVYTSAMCNCSALHCTYCRTEPKLMHNAVDAMVNPLGVSIICFFSHASIKPLHNVIVNQIFQERESLIVLIYCIIYSA